MVDVLAIAIIVGVGLLGYLLGFGKVLKFVTGGVVGIILTVVIVYFSFNVVLAFPFVQSLLDKLIVAIQGTGSAFLIFLFETLKLDIIVFAVGLYFLVSLLRKLLVNIISNLMETDVAAIKIINRVLGAILMLFWLVVLTLIIFQVLYWIPSTQVSVNETLSESFFLGKLFNNNPLISLIDLFKARS